MYSEFISEYPDFIEVIEVAIYLLFVESMNLWNFLE
jgi:hypothetical protein